MKSLFKSSDWKSWDEIGKPLNLPALEIISIHVEKTAGTSFYDELKRQYGAEQVLRIDTHQHPTPRFNGQDKLDVNALNKIKVIHGHFLRDDLNKYLIYPKSKPKMISWLRDPAERILSNYNHLSSRIAHYVDTEKSPQLLDKMMRTFEEFIHRGINQNRLALYLKDYAPEEFAFIGNVEHYKEDLMRLSDELNWDKSKIEYSSLNHSTKVKSTLSEKEIAQIKKLNHEDYQVYEQFLKVHKSN